MQAILKFYWQMGLLRVGPDRLPALRSTLGVIVVACLVIELVEASFAQPDREFTTITIVVIMTMCIQAAVTFLLLLFFNYRHRYIATLSAIFGAYALLSIILLPFIMLMQNGENRSMLVLAQTVYWICLGWRLTIAGHIYHRAVNISLLQGAALAFITELLSAYIVFSFFPAKVT